MKTTGKLGDVMKESIDAAASFVRAISTDIGVKPPKFQTVDIHVHVPEGATPKDGPSAGVAMVTSIVSVLTQIPVRKDIAMTGEVTLRGNVRATGGLKEKLLAALRGGIKTVLIPADNEKDLAEIPDNVKEGLTIIPVSNVREVLKAALVRMPEPVEWEEAAEEARALAGRAAAQSDAFGAAVSGAAAWCDQLLPGYLEAAYTPSVAAEKLAQLAVGASRGICSGVPAFDLNAAVVRYWGRAG